MTRRAATVAPLVTFVVLAIAFFPFTTDDAYISLRYARNVASGAGAVFDVQPRGPEAYSSPLWMLAAAVAFAGGATDDGAVAWIKGLGLVFGLATLFVLRTYTRAWTRDDSAGTRAAWLAALMPWLSFWSVGGLETPVYVLLVIAALLEIHAEDADGHRGWLSGALLVFVTLARPEGVLLALAMIAGSFASGRRAWLRMAIVCIAFAAYSAWHFLYFGALLPATFSAKRGDATIGQIWQRTIELAPLALYLSPLAVIYVFRRARDPRLPAPAIGAVCACVVFALMPRLEDGPGFRYEMVLLPLAASGAAAGWRFGPWSRHSWKPAMGHVLLAMFLLSPIAALWPPARHSPPPEEIAFGRWLRVHAPEASVGVYNLGAIPYYSRLPRVLDTNPSGPLSPFPRGTYDPQAILSQAPTFLLLPPADAVLAHDPLAGIVRAPGLRQEYEPLFDLALGDDYRVAIWKRQEHSLDAAALDDARSFGLTR